MLVIVASLSGKTSLLNSRTIIKYKILYKYNGMLFEEAQHAFDDTFNIFNCLVLHFKIIGNQFLLIKD